MTFGMQRVAWEGQHDLVADPCEVRAHRVEGLLSRNSDRPVDVVRVDEELEGSRRRWSKKDLARLPRSQDGARRCPKTVCRFVLIVSAYLTGGQRKEIKASVEPTPLGWRRYPATERLEAPRIECEVSAFDELREARAGRRIERAAQARRRSRVQCVADDRENGRFFQGFSQRCHRECARQECVGGKLPRSRCELGGEHMPPRVAVRLVDFAAGKDHSSSEETGLLVASHAEYLEAPFALSHDDDGRRIFRGDGVSVCVEIEHGSGAYREPGPVAGQSGACRGGSRPLVAFWPGGAPQ